MQANTMSRWLSPLLAFCLSFIIIATLAPLVGIGFERQFDFWGLWLLSMLILALPLCYLEIALAKRSKTTALHALAQLTRDADSSSHWRLVGWLAVVFMPFLAGAMLANTSQLMVNNLALDFTSQLIFIVLLLVAIALSFAPRLIIVALTAVAVLAALGSAQLGGAEITWQMTAIEFSEWGGATILALVASGLGLGLYWQSSLVNVNQSDVATQTVLPIWIAQILAVVAFAFFAVNSAAAAVVFMVSIVSGAALLLHMAREQLQQRQLALPIQGLVLVLASVIWVIPNHGIFNTLLMLWGLVICLIYTIFAGWIMKISHLRKSMNFSHEAIYNIWRIAVRIVVPLAIILALIAFIGNLI